MASLPIAGAEPNNNAQSDARNNLLARPDVGITSQNTSVVSGIGVILILDADRRRRNENQEKREAARAVVSDR